MEKEQVQGVIVIPDTTQDKFAIQIYNQRLSMIYELRIPFALVYVERPVNPREFGYKCYSYTMYSQFKCPNFHNFANNNKTKGNKTEKQQVSNRRKIQTINIWTSDMGYFQIWFKFQNMKKYHLPIKIPFFIHLYGQMCRQCKQRNFITMQYDSQTRNSFQDASRKFLNFIVRILLGAIPSMDKEDSGNRNKLKRHEIYLCQACKLNKCSYKGRRTEKQ